MPVPSSFRVFRHRSFTTLWCGSLVSNVGTWMETVALGRYVQEETGRATWGAAVAAAGFIPTAIVGLVGGALADRMRRNILIIGSSLFQAMIAAVVTMLVMRDAATPAALTILAFLAGCGGAIGFPAWQTSVPEMVPPDEVPAAIGLSSVQWNLGRVLGPVIAGVVISVWGITTALWINVVSFFAVTIAASLVRIPPPRAGSERRSIGETILDGARIVVSTPGLRAVSLTMMASVFFAAPFIGLIPAMVEQVLKGSRSVNSALVTAQGIGAVVAGFSMGSLVGRFGVRRTMVGLLAVLCPALVLYGIAPNVWTMAPALAVVGGCYMGKLSSYSTIGQTLAPGASRGRVMAINNAILGVFYPLGLMVQGPLGDWIGLRWVTAGSGVALAAVMVAVRLVRPGFTAPVQPPPPPHDVEISDLRALNAVD